MHWIRSVLPGLIEEAELHVTWEQLVHFIRHAIEQREYFKFEFTKSLSLILELLVRAGTIMGNCQK